MYVRIYNAFWRVLIFDFTLDIFQQNKLLKNNTLSTPYIPLCTYIHMYPYVRKKYPISNQNYHSPIGILFSALL